MQYAQISFEGFTGRDEALEKVQRYGMYKTMFYRTNLRMHTRRTRWILEELLPVARQVLSFDEQKACVIAEVHDDPEIITGDVQLGRKMYTMSAGQIEQGKQAEEAAAEQLSRQWPKTVNGFNYRDLLFQAIHKNSVEAMLGSFSDKLDAFGEALHEIYAGNEEFTYHKELPRGVNPLRVYMEILPKFKDKYPLLKKLFEQNHPLLLPLQNINEVAIARKGAPHNFLSIKEKTGHTHYDVWREITLHRGGPEGLRWLTEQKEFAT